MTDPAGPGRGGTELLTTAEVAGLLRLNPQTLWKWRRAGKGPRWVRVGHRVRYPSGDLKDYLDPPAQAS